MFLLIASSDLVCSVADIPGIFTASVRVFVSCGLIAHLFSNCCNYLC